MSHAPDSIGRTEPLWLPSSARSTAEAHLFATPELLRHPLMMSDGVLQRPLPDTSANNSLAIDRAGNYHKICTAAIGPLAAQRTVETAHEEGLTVLSFTTTHYEAFKGGPKFDSIHFLGHTAVDVDAIFVDRYSWINGDTCQVFSGSELLWIQDDPEFYKTLAGLTTDDPGEYGVSDRAIMKFERDQMLADSDFDYMPVLPLATNLRYLWKK